MTGMNSELSDGNQPNLAHAQRNFARLMAYVANLYCMNESSSVSAREMAQLAASVIYVLGIADATEEEAAMTLCADDPIALWHKRLAALDARTDAALATWRNIVLTMPPIRNVSLRDTLASLGDLKLSYDTRFAAHEVPCDIDYQLSEPIDVRLQGIDYIEAWLAQLERETRWIAQFDTPNCIAVLERTCPDYRGPHVNLYDLLSAHADELQTGSAASLAFPSSYPTTMAADAARTEPATALRFTRLA